MRKAILPVFLLLIAANLQALDMSSGKIRLSLYRDTGRYSIYYESSSGLYVPLFYATDPRTSVLILRVGGAFYRMGDSRDFQTSVEQGPSGGTITWTSAQLTVKEVFSFAASNGATEADGVRIAIVITNKSGKALSVGARMIIDTYLGEQDHIPFKTPTGTTISSEAEYLAPQLPAYWLSPKNPEDTVALECVTTGSGVTEPSRIVFANWKRLYDTDWNFSVQPGRAFNLLPYSINDSAVSMYYDPQMLQAGASRTINLLLGQYDPKGWPGAGQAEAGGTTSSTTSPQMEASHPSAAAAEVQAPPANTRAAVESDLKSVQESLDQINSLLSGRTQPSQSNIQALSKALDKLESSRNNYTGK